MVSCLLPHLGEPACRARPAPIDGGPGTAYFTHWKLLLISAHQQSHPEALPRWTCTAGVRPGSLSTLSCLPDEASNHPA